MGVSSSYVPSWAREVDAFTFTPGAGSGGRRSQKWDARGQLDAHRWGKGQETGGGGITAKGQHEEVGVSTPNLTSFGFATVFL